MLSDDIYITYTGDYREVGRLLKQWSGKDFDDKYMMHESHFLVARNGEQSVGCAQLVVINDPFWGRSWGLIENVYVAQDYRRQGIAQQLMEAILREAANFHCDFVKLTSSYDKKAAHELYQGLGFEQGLSFKKQIDWRQYLGKGSDSGLF